MEVGSDVTKIRAGDNVGVGYIVGCCRTCEACKLEKEQYCNKKVFTYGDVDTNGEPTQGGFAGAMVVDQKYGIHTYIHTYKFQNNCS